MSGRWWRAYDEAVDDPKLQQLRPEVFRAWFNLCCITSANGGVLPPLSVIAFKIRMSQDKARHIIAELAALKLIDESNGQFAPHNWSGRQFQSDVSTSRVKRFRERHRHVSSAVSEAPPEAETEPETDRSLRSRESARDETDHDPSPRATRLPPDFKPDHFEATKRGLSAAETDTEVEKFHNHYAGAPGRHGLKLDWPATWRNWCIRACEMGVSNGQRPRNNTNGNGRPKPANDAILEAVVREFAAPPGEGEREAGAHGRDDDQRGGTAGSSGRHLELESRAYRGTS